MRVKTPNSVSSEPGAGHLAKDRYTKLPSLSVESFNATIASSISANTGSSNGLVAIGVKAKPSGVMPRSSYPAILGLDVFLNCEYHNTDCFIVFCDLCPPGKARKWEEIMILRG